MRANTILKMEKSRFIVRVQNFVLKILAKGSRSLLGSSNDTIKSRREVSVSDCI